MYIKVAGQIVKLEIKDESLAFFLNKEYRLHKENVKTPFQIVVYKNNNNYFINAKKGFKTIIRITVSTKKNFDFIEFIIRCLIQICLLESNILLLHGSSIKIKRYGNIFVGPPNSGKSTIVKKINEKLIMGDDTAIVKIANKKFFIYNSPFDFRKAPWIKEKKSILKNIFILKKSSENKKLKIDEGKIFNQILINSFLFIFIKFISNKENNLLLQKRRRKFYDLIFRLISKIQVQELHFNKSINPQTL